MSEIAMRFDKRDVWPANVPLGTFECRRTRLKGRPAVTGFIFFVCPRGRRCGVYLAPAFEGRRSKDEPNVWGWDGNLKCPTLTPSINCVQKVDPDTRKQVAGCGWHGHITAGKMTAA